MIGPNHVLTAAHCFVDDEYSPVYEYDVIVGEHDVTSTEDGARHKVCGRTIHPKYIPTGTNYDYDYDFAIIRLQEPVSFGVRAVPACLPNSDFEGTFLDDKTMRVSGWGTFSEGADGPNRLHSVDLPGITNADCTTKLQNHDPTDVITDAMLCTGSDPGGVSPCYGDSGGM